MLELTDIFPRIQKSTGGLFVVRSLSSISSNVDIHVLAYFVENSPNKIVEGNYPFSVEAIPYRPRKFLVRETNKARAMKSSLLKWLRNSPSRARVDFVQGEFVVPGGYLAVYLARCLKIPSVVTVLGSDVNLYPQYRFLRSMVIRTLKNADGVIAVSSALANRCVDLGVEASRIRVIRMGVDTSLFYVKEEKMNLARFIENFCPAQGASVDDVEKSNLILFVGNLVPVKKPLTFLAILHQLIKNRPNCVAIMVGKGSLKEECSRFINHCGLSQTVIAIDELEPEKIAMLMQRASVLVLTSEAEGVPNVVVESLACGTPVVASDIDGIREVITDGQNGALVKVGDVDAFSKAISKTLDAEHNPHDLAATVRNLTWEDHAAQKLAFYHEVVERYKSND
jgi:teichuronic acid biosynthesis glycosyltransferase TuaC